MAIADRLDDRFQPSPLLSRLHRQLTQDDLHVEGRVRYAGVLSSRSGELAVLFETRDVNRLTGWCLFLGGSVALQAECVDNWVQWKSEEIRYTLIEWLDVGRHTIDYAGLAPVRYAREAVLEGEARASPWLPNSHWLELQRFPFGFMT